MIHVLQRQQVIPAGMDRVWDYFSKPQNLNDLTPPDMCFLIVRGGEQRMYAGQLIEYRVQFAPGIRSRWLTEIRHVQEQAYFVDEQRIGPYRFWYHEHLFEAVPAGVKMTDRVTFEVPFGLLGEIVYRLWIRRRLEHIFDFRAVRVTALFAKS